MNILTETAVEAGVDLGVYDAVTHHLYLAPHSTHGIDPQATRNRLVARYRDDVHATIVAVADQSWTREDVRSAAYARTLTLLNEEHR